MQHKQEKHLSLKTFTEAVTDGDAILRSIPNAGKKIRRLFKNLTSYASDPKKGLTQKELRSKVPLRLWAKPAAEGDNEGALPCDHNQEYQPCSDEEFKKMDNYIEERLKVRPESAAKPKSEAPITHKRVWPAGRPKSRQTREEL